MLIYLDEESAIEVEKALDYYCGLSFNPKALINIINQIKEGLKDYEK